MARSPSKTNWSCFKSQGIDPRAIPLSYRISTTDHGVSFFLWAEGFDKQGDCFSWFVVQRPVRKDGSVVDSGKQPLFCVFAVRGNTNLAHSEDIVACADSILKFVVSEKDVNSPTVPQSAVLQLPDSKAIMNPLQQVALSEDNNYLIFVPQGVNTHRYAYSYELDMIAYTSADVLSQNQIADLNMYSEPSAREYIGMQANFPYNTGMRLLFRIS